MATQKHPHFVLIPFMAQGHMIPLVDIAKMLARWGAIVTIFTTPVNAKRFDSVLTQAVAAGLLIRVIQIDFPSAKAGLPEGCECFDMLTSVDLTLKFFAACKMLQPSVEEKLKELKPSPSCIVADMFHPWANQVAEKFGVPRLIFHVFCCLALLCKHNLTIFKELNDITSDSKYFAVPDLPHRIELTKAQTGGFDRPMVPEWKDLHEEIEEAENGAMGFVLNTFEELEPDYVAQFRKTKGKKVWCVGPVSLCNKDDIDIAERGNKASINSDQCLKWLESWGEYSVVYACLGSINRPSTAQLIELGLGLEESNQPFIWVMRDPPSEFQKWLLEEKFEERLQGRGLLIKGWAPQVLILSHPSIGGFLTHCGWNSTIEAICSGVPMITWPMISEQFVNEKLLVNVLKIGVKAGMEIPVMIGQDDTVGVQVTKKATKMAIDELMDEGEEGQMRRRRAQELGKIARKALDEGHSSYQNLTQLIQDITDTMSP